ncbi:response regulator [Cupriavidus sp. HPC(L)]|nr:response regulator [Cupriavidus sp. HPC(L)]
MDMHAGSHLALLSSPESMTTILLANNAIMVRALSRYLGKRQASRPLTLQSPEWLLNAPSTELPKQPVDFALLDCSSSEADPVALIDALCQRIAPCRWLLIARPGATALTQRAARAGAGGCLLAPASPDLVCAAVALVSAGGQCFPRASMAWLMAPAPAPASNFLRPGSTASG